MQSILRALLVSIAFTAISSLPAIADCGAANAGCRSACGAKVTGGMAAGDGGIESTDYKCVSNCKTQYIACRCRTAFQYCLGKAQDAAAVARCNKFGHKC